MIRKTTLLILLVTLSAPSAATRTSAVVAKFGGECLETKEFSIPLLPGNNYLTAQFEGTGANAVNLDMPGIKLMNFWFGKVESNTLTMHAK